ncbi:MAG: AI-2E family transporter [Muribaculaceae bacterium]|nr:AI-2E family transporter [Muribaculaceae bacterium]
MITSRTKKRYDFDRVTRLVITIVCIVVAVFVINYLRKVLLPFLIGGLLAYMLNPLVELIRKVLHLKGRAVASVLAIAIAFGTIVTALWFLIPYLISEVSSMTTMLTHYAKTSFQVPHIPAAVHDFIRENIDLSQWQKLLTKEQWVNLINNVLSGTWSVLGGTLRVILSIFTLLLVLLYMFFILLDYDKIKRNFKAAIPPKYRRIGLKIIRDVEQTMSRYFRGQALVSLFVGIIFAIEFYIIGLPMAIAFGLFIGLLNMVPYLQLVSLPIAAFLCLVLSVDTNQPFWPLFGWTFIAYCICQVIQDLVLIPLIMRQQMGLNPAIVFLSLSIWGYILGFVGLIIALPLTTLIISYYSEYVLHVPNPLYKKNKKKKKKKKHKDGVINSNLVTNDNDQMTYGSEQEPAIYQNEHDVEESPVQL